MDKKFNKNRLIGEIDTTLYHAKEIIDARIDVKTFQIFSEQYDWVYRQIQENYKEITTDNEMLKNQIDNLQPFIQSSGHSNGLLGYLFNLFKEKNDVGEVREAYNRFSVIKMLMENN